MDSAWTDVPLPGKHPWMCHPDAHRWVVPVLGALVCPSDGRGTLGRQRGGWLGSDPQPASLQAVDGVHQLPSVSHGLSLLKCGQMKSWTPFSCFFSPAQMESRAELGLANMTLIFRASSSSCFRNEEEKKIAPFGKTPSEHQHQGSALWGGGCMDLL